MLSSSRHYFITFETKPFFFSYLFFTGGLTYFRFKTLVPGCCCQKQESFPDTISPYFPSGKDVLSLCNNISSSPTATLDPHFLVKAIVLSILRVHVTPPALQHCADTLLTSLTGGHVMLYTYNTVMDACAVGLSPSL